MNNAQPSVLVVGAGAIGAFYGHALARGGARVSVVCRSDYDAVRASGYTMNSDVHGNSQFIPAATYRDVSEVSAQPDFVVLAVKVVDGLDRAGLIRAVVGADTRIVLIQNGIDIEPEIASAFPGNELISCLAFIAVSRVAPGVVHHQSFGRLNVGSWPEGASAGAEQFAGLLSAGGIEARITTDVVAARWQKAVWNAPFNPFSIVGGALTTAQMLATPESEAFVRRAMQEVCAVAEALGKPQSPKVIEQNITGTRSMPPYKTSMALDFENGRPLELEAILGNVVRAARKTDVPIPTLESLYAVAKTVVAARAQR
jgi:2-dehydropantoate 2-reductase